MSIISQLRAMSTLVKTLVIKARHENAWRLLRSTQLRCDGFSFPLYTGGL